MKFIAKILCKVFVRLLDNSNNRRILMNDRQYLQRRKKAGFTYEIVSELNNDFLIEFFDKTGASTGTRLYFRKEAVLDPFG